MEYNTISPIRKDSKISKIFNLKLLGIPSNLDQNLVENLRKRKSYATTRNSQVKQNISNSIDKIDDENILTISKKKNDDKKIKYLINNKSINNSITNTFFYQFNKKYYSRPKYSSNDNVLKLNISKNNEQYDKNKNLRQNIRAQTIITIKSNKNKMNLFPRLKVSNSNKKDYKNLNNFNNRINNKLNQNSMKSNSVKHYTLRYSTASSFFGLNTNYDDLIRKKKFKETTFRNINKKNFNNFIFSKSNSNIINLKNFSSLIKKMGKYPFVVNPNPLITTEFSDLPSTVRNMNKKYSIILKRENDKLFSHYFSIISKEKFSKKYQNIANLYDIKDKSDKKKKKKKKESNKNEENINSEEESQESDSFINEKIISGKKLVNEIKYLIQKGAPMKIKKKLLYDKFKKFMILLNSKLEMMPVYLDEIIKYYKVPKHSYGFPATHELLFSIRTKNLKMVNKLLDKYNYLVLDYDYFSMTPLHWAVKYNFYQIIPKLVGYGSNVNAQNYIGETPLLIGVKRKFMESVVFLLIYIASPFIKDNKGFGIFDYSKSEFRMKSIFNKIIFLHYASMLGPTKNIYEYIQSKFIEYVFNENKNDLEIEAFNMIKERLEYYKRKNNIK